MCALFPVSKYLSLSTPNTAWFEYLVWIDTSLLEDIFSYSKKKCAVRYLLWILITPVALILCILYMNIHTFCPLRPSCWKTRILSWCERWNNTFPKIPYSVKPVNMLAYMATGTWQVIHLRILRQGSYPGLYMQSCGPYMRKRGGSESEKEMWQWKQRLE